MYAKCTLVLNGVGPSGWTEVIYSTGTDQATIASNVTNTLVSARRMMLGVQTQILGLRVQDINTPGSSQFFPYSNLRGTGPDTDTPWQSLLLRCLSNVGQQRNFWCRAFPDSWITLGQLGVSGSANYAQMMGAINALIAALNSGYFNISYVDRTAQAAAPLVGIDANGNVITFKTMGTLTIGQHLRCYRTKYVGGGNVSQALKVVAFTDGQHFQVQPWPTGRTVVLGTIRTQPGNLAQIRTTEVDRVGKRTVGRPFAPYHGRVRRR